MSSAASARDFAAIWDISTPSRLGRLPGVSMAGFRSRTPDPVDIRIIPYPAVTVFIEFGGDGIVVDDDSGRQQRGSVVVGLVPGSVRGNGRDIECLQVRLSPSVAYAVLGAPGLLGETVVALDDLWGREAGYMHERLRNAGSWDERFAIAEAALARRLEAGRVMDPEISLAWEQMSTRRGRRRVDQLAGKIGWSRKRLWSQFRSQVGITPKRAAQLVRFDRAAHRLAAGQSIAQVALESGYVAQSHLNRDVMGLRWGDTHSRCARAVARGRRHRLARSRAQVQQDPDDDRHVALDPPGADIYPRRHRARAAHWAHDHSPGAQYLLPVRWRRSTLVTLGAIPERRHRGQLDLAPAA